MTTHTPTPWHLETKIEGHLFVESDKGFIADVQLEQCQDEKEKFEAIANAAFIVRAVNAHEKLLEALRRAAGFLRCAHSEQALAEQWDSEEAEDVYAMVFQAIAKAEGR